jgi:hypothetical protein
MNCERYQLELEDFLYGELTEKRAAEVRAHLAGCADCAAERDQLQREHELFAQFYEETALDPTSEMWNAVRAGIEGAPRPTAPEPHTTSGGSFDWLWRPALLRQSAFAGLLVALSVAATMYFMRRGTERERDVVARSTPSVSPRPMASPSPAVTPGGVPSQGSIPAPRPAPPPALRKDPPKPLSEQELIRQQLAKAEREYRGAIRLLDRAIARRRDSLDPNVIREYESSLALIDDSIARGRRAMQAQPGDASAGQFLLAAYAKKVELMQDVAMR